MQLVFDDPVELFRRSSVNTNRLVCWIQEPLPKSDREHFLLNISTRQPAGEPEVLDHFHSFWVLLFYLLTNTNDGDQIAIPLKFVH